ncbi:hypothetical protein QZH41_017509, partial [Actinostola sp. cb2023]
AIDGKTDADAVDYLVYHLDLGAAKDEVRLRPATEWNTPALVMKILRACFSEQLTETQAMRKFFERRQGDRESTTDYAHAIMVLLSRVEQLSVDPLPGKDRLLRDQFVESLNNVQLRRDTKRWGERLSGKFKAEGDEVTLCGEVRNTSAYQKIIADLVAGQKTLAEGLQKTTGGPGASLKPIRKENSTRSRVLRLWKNMDISNETAHRGGDAQTGTQGNNNPPQPPQQPALNGNSPQQ